MSETTQIIVLLGIILVSGSVIVRYAFKRYRRYHCEHVCSRSDTEGKQCAHLDKCPTRRADPDSELTQLGLPKRD